MTHGRLILLTLDAKDACLRLLSRGRTRGRFELHMAVSDLYEWLARS
jgi:hypothetical protein